MEPSTSGASASGLSHDEYYYFLQFAATVIQRHWRGYRVRKAHYAQVRAERERWEAEQAEQALRELQDQAARVIQLAWQSFRNRRIYQYYRDLIQFRERGDPKEMLRAINPREATLLDAALGAHVRFRLGGAMFPPLVFYKIFTHRPIADINAFGPRNYCAEITLTAREIHSKPAKAKQHKKKKHFSEDFELSEQLREYIRPDGTIGYRSTRGWYERVENNGWRPISERILVDIDPVTAATQSARIANFHYSPAIRREEKVRRAKQRRREWLRKIYAQTCQGDPSSSGNGVEQGVSGGVCMPGSSLADLNDEELDDLQVEELLEWSHHLDYTHYMEDWSTLACTLGSESFVPELESAHMPQLPPASVNLASAMVAAGVPMAAFKGGVTPAAGATSGLIASS